MFQPKLNTCPSCHENKIPEYDVAAGPQYPMLHTLVSQCTGCGWVISKQIEKW